MKNKVNILGSEYTIKMAKRTDDPKLQSDCDGYCDTSIKLLVVEEMQREPQSVSDLGMYAKQVLRHEIIHAFMHESGLSASSCCFDGGWAINEEMIDWFAIQSPKIFKAFQEVGCL